MHKLAEKMAECLKAKVEGMGIDNIEGENLSELGMWVDILKDMASFDKDMRIIKAMDEAEENEKKMKYIEEYEDYPEIEDMRRGYRGQPRDAMGRYTSRRRGGMRMGYEEPPYWHEMMSEYPMSVEMYHDYTPEQLRDMDRPHGKMYYTEPVRMPNMPMKDESRYERTRKGYEEKKTMGADKQEKMKSLEEYMKTIAEELTQAVEGASPEERAMIKAKLNTVATKM